MARAHFIGIGGTGQSGLARVLHARGYDVGGCDVQESPTTRRLAAEGILIQIGHDPAHAPGQDLVVYSPACRGDGAAEIASAHTAGVEVLARSELLARLFTESEGIAVAGTHGKTTVTAMLGHVLTTAGLDPTVLVGDGASSRVGQSRWLVAEADESDGSLALHRPRHGLLTGVELDHPDHFADVEEVDGLFRSYIARIPGFAVVCADCPRASTMATSGRLVSYGLAPDASYRCVEMDGGFAVMRSGDTLARLRLAVPGAHNRQNATGVLALAVELGVAPEVAAGALATFTGASRRLERLGTWRGATIYDDYGHHPTEVVATLAAARELGAQRLVLVFQPHRYTRYAALRDDFARSMRGADAVVVAEIYAAGERGPTGVSASGLAARVPGARFAPDLAAARAHLEEIVEEGDLVLLMGAGDIWKLGHELADTG